MIYVLLFSVLVMFIISFIISKKDLLSPACIVCIVWVLGTISVIYNIGYWNVSINTSTYWIFISSIGVFMIFSFLGDFIAKKSTVNKKKIKEKGELKYIDLNNRIFCFFLIYNIIVTIMVVLTVWRTAGITSMFGNVNFSSQMAQYRGGDEALPTLIKQLYKVMKCDTYIFIYVLCNNLQFKGKKVRERLRLIFPILLFCVSSLSTGSRTDTLHAFIAIIVMYYIKMQQSRRWSAKVNYKFVFGCLIAIICFFAFFNFIKTYVGRLNALDPVRYLTAYAGGSIQLFDQYKGEPYHKSVQFGQLTFTAAWKNIEKLGLGKWMPSGLEFRMSNGHLVGNLYTSIRRYYQDFGLVGNYFLQAVLALFYSIYYRIIKKSEYNKGFKIVFYCMIVSPLFLHAIDDTFFSGFICINTVVLCIITKILYDIMINNKLKNIIK